MNRSIKIVSNFFIIVSPFFAAAGYPNQGNQRKSSKIINFHNLYLGGSINYYDRTKNKQDIALGLALAYARFLRGIHKHEMSIECFLPEPDISSLVYSTRFTVYY